MQNISAPLGSVLPSAISGEFCDDEIQLIDILGTCGLKLIADFSLPVGISDNVAHSKATVQQLPDAIEAVSARAFRH